jgi:hypothetical protein
MEEHLVLLRDDEDSSSDDNNNRSDDDDSSVEISSTPDECESELIRLSTYLQLASEVDNDDDDQTFEWPDPLPSLFSSCLSDIKLLNGLNHLHLYFPHIRKVYMLYSHQKQQLMVHQ